MKHEISIFDKMPSQGGNYIETISVDAKNTILAVKAGLKQAKAQSSSPAYSKASGSLWARCESDGRLAATFAGRRGMTVFSIE